MENLERLIMDVMDYAPIQAVDIARGLSIDYEVQVTTSRVAATLADLAARGYVRMFPTADGSNSTSYEKLHELNT